MSMINRNDFPKNFVWGAATSSFQIEGATTADGRGPSIWDTFCATLGKTRNGDTGEPGCDHYNRYKTDLDLMKDLNLEAYRFSTAWSRVLPTGRGQVNEKGLGFYERLVDGLLERDITPWLTLYHWDLPQALEDLGGWSARDTVHAFEEYAHVMSERLGDRVKHWITHNEPWCTAYLGYQTGYFAPGIQDTKRAIQASHHLLLSHGLSVPIIRANSSNANVGITLNLWPVHAASDSSEDQAAAKRLDGLSNRWYLDPLYGRGYPQDILDIYGEDAPEIQTGDLAKIAVETDFIGVNYYIRHLVKHSDNAAQGHLEFVKSDLERTDFDWEIYPQGLAELALRLGTEYQAKEVYITESGACYDDTMIDGQVNDEKRRKYLELHLEASSEAIKQGAPLMGYFAWSLMDNFEWAEGYARRFGIVHVDFETQVRTIKSSGRFYQNFLKGSVLD
jgi:beta-glucosidase